MGTAGAAFVKANRKEPEPPAERKTSAMEKLALKKLRREAKRAGATLESGGEGGLPSSLVLGVMRRDRYRCKTCGGQKHLSLHHKGGLEHPGSKWLAKKGHSNDPNNIVTTCKDCHDNIHNKDRAKGAEHAESLSGEANHGY